LRRRGIHRRRWPVSRRLRKTRKIILWRLRRKVGRGRRLGYRCGKCGKSLRTSRPLPIALLLGGLLNGVLRRLLLLLANKFSLAGCLLRGLLGSNFSTLSSLAGCLLRSKICSLTG